MVLCWQRCAFGCSLLSFSGFHLVEDIPEGVWSSWNLVFEFLEICLGHARLHEIARRLAKHLFVDSDASRHPSWLVTHTSASVLSSILCTIHKLQIQRAAVFALVASTMSSTVVTLIS